MKKTIKKDASKTVIKKKEAAGIFSIFAFFELLTISLVMFICVGFFSVAMGLLYQEDNLNTLKTDIFQVSDSNQSAMVQTTTTPQQGLTNTSTGTAVVQNGSTSSASVQNNQPMRDNQIQNPAPTTVQVTNQPTAMQANGAQTSMVITKAPQTGMKENLVIFSAVFLGILGSIMFVGFKMRWF